MWRPSFEWQIPSWLSVAIAVGLGSAGIWCARTGLSGWDGSDGFERLASAVLLLFAGGAFLLSTIALMFARSSPLFWVGLIALLVAFFGITRPSHQRTSHVPRSDTSVSASAQSVGEANPIGRSPMEGTACLRERRERGGLSAWQRGK